MKKILSVVALLAAMFFLFANCSTDSSGDSGNENQKTEKTDEDEKSKDSDESEKEDDGKKTEDGKTYYTLSLDANGGEGSISYNNIETNKEFKLEKAKGLGVSREGYTFAGWARSATAISANYDDGDSVIVNSDITLYAVWVKNTEAENTDKPGEGENPGKTDEEDKPGENENPGKTEEEDKPGETDNPAQTDEPGKQDKPTEQEQEKPSEKEDEQKTIKYTIRFNSNASDASGSLSDIAASQGEVLTLPKSTFLRTGFTFEGWAKTSSATSADYADGASVKDLSSTDGEVVTLYAVWMLVVKEAELSSIYFNRNPAKTEYKYGESVDVSGAELIAAYSDGTKKTIESGFTVSPEKLNSVGSQTVTVTYEGKTVTFDVEVYNELTGLSFMTKPYKTLYDIGDSVDTDGTVLLATYSDGTSKTIESGFSVSPETLDSEGEQTITITYGEKTVTYRVDVIKSLSFSLNVTIRDFTDEDGLLSYYEKTNMFIAKDGFKKYKWWIDDKAQSITDGFCKITQSLVSDKRNHTIMVIVTDDDGNRYSATAEFTLR
ncbi:hypothetical protein DYE50_03625 [Treponema ruminis]|uniref:Putative repeat protein (TIGR02543 family) n=1 Tax=Treponema ruminis TaxID=744515 RepID=A0A7W8G818_9SPIR|nr:InlB B-repeat-containing protein [Treponema ruminis]MBB5225462.1 putative repeat protein (TIGR02543 family) [Treponema ruminis]QSI01669.1 hypothetical protein DYE50_03625 [Treponema ruminis]